MMMKRIIIIRDHARREARRQGEQRKEIEDAEAAYRGALRALRRTAKRELRELERLVSESPTDRNLYASTLGAQGEDRCLRRGRGG